MKKNLILWGIGLILVAVAVFTMNNHNKTVDSAIKAGAPTATAVIVSGPKAEAFSPSPTVMALSTPVASASPSPAQSAAPTATQDKAKNLTAASTSTPKAASAPSPAPTTSPKPAPTATPASTGGNKAANFTLQDIDGKKVSLSNFAGKKVFLNFWATWCPPCRGEMPDIEKIYQENKDNKDFVILAVNLGEDRDTVKSFLEKNNYNFRVVLDMDTSVAGLYNINAIPTSFIIDANGNITNHIVGAMTEAQMRKFIQ